MDRYVACLYDENVSQQLHWKADADSSPEDVAMATLIIKYCGKNLNVVLEPHPQMAPLPQASQQMLEDTFMVHASLGSNHSLYGNILKGIFMLPVQAPIEQLALPSLDV